MLRRLVARVALALVIAVVIVPVAFAQQPLGTFRWQLAPFCNVITVAVTQSASTFTLDGFDDQCSAATRAAVIGTAFPNPNGSLGIGLSIVATPGAAPVHVDVALSLATIGGPWRDSAGNSGTFLFSPPTPATGEPRPATGGLISMVTPGVGLSGGGITGAVNLAVNFGGGGTATTVARSDHTHAVTGIDNVGVGPAALGIVTGASNTAMGSRALASLSTGQLNTAVGHDALTSVSTAEGNVGVGYRALIMSTGPANTAVGANALFGMMTGNANTALGSAALSFATGSQNIAVGFAAGHNLRSGVNNIYIGNAGPPAIGDESGQMRIGNPNTTAAAFMAGIFGTSVVAGASQEVFVDVTGKLGTTVSSARFKHDIQPLVGISAMVQGLEPVSFRYVPDQQRGNALQYGLIAEQVAEVLPDLVIRDEEGQPFTVKYHLLPTLLLAEIQRLERERASQADAIAAQARAIGELREELRVLRSEQR